jgi:hypothetical protein
MELQKDKGKTVVILAYCTIFWFIITIVMNSDQNNKSELGLFYIRQALGVFLISFTIGILKKSDN